LEYLAEVGERPNVTVHVIPFSAGLHGLLSADMWYLRLPDGRTVAYTENGYRGELIEETVDVERLLLTFDSVRDLALPPAASREFVLRVLEEVTCDPSI
jgi:hypothetical protein